MTRMLLTLLAVIFSVVSAEAQQLDRKVFAGKGSFQKFVNFSFEVPVGNCGNLEIYEFVRGDSFGTVSQWKRLLPGEITPTWGGFYRFVNNEAECATRFSISGEVSEIQQIETISLIEVEPQEVGMFVEGVWEPFNTFNLPEEDAEFSYDLLMPAWGVNTSLGALIKDELVTSFDKLVGVIVSDSRGFLKRKIWGRRKVVSQAESVWFGPDDVAVLVYYERR